MAKLLAALDRSLEMNPLVADAWLNKGLAFNAMQKYADAVSAFNKVIG